MRFGPCRPGSCRVGRAKSGCSPSTRTGQVRRPPRSRGPAAGLSVHQPARHAGRGDRRLPERPPRLIASAVRAVEDVGAGRFGIDDRAPFDPPDLFREEWIVRDVRLYLLRQGISGVEPVRVGQPDDLRQRFLPRPAHLRVALRPPGDATGDDGERDGSRRELHAARRPRPRDRRQRA